MGIRVVVFASILAVSAYANVLERDESDEATPIVCTALGTFPVPGDCQEYYTCEQLRESGILYPQISSCPNETIFDETRHECMDTSLVASPPECLHEGSISVHLPDMIADTENICNRIKNIDDMETAVISSINLRRSLDFAVTFNGYVEHYNRDLEALQADVGIWRKGDDILSQIRRIYSLVKAYENEFNRKYGIATQRLTTIPRKVETRRTSLIEDIKNLKNDIKATKSGGELLKDRTAQLEARLEKKEARLGNITKIKLELEELIPFIEFTSNDVNRIVAKASVSLGKIGELYRDMVNAEDTFQKYVVNTTRDLDNLKKEDMQLEEQLQTKKKEVLDLESNKNDLRDKERELERDIDETLEHVRHLSERINDFQVSFSGIKILFCEVQFKDLLDFLHDIEPDKRCDHLTNEMGEKYKGVDAENELEGHNATLTELRTEIEKLHSQFNKINQDLKAVRDSISPIEERKRQIRTEVRDFEMFKPDVENLVTEINSKLSDIVDTKEGLQKVESVFRSITEVLDRLVARAKEEGATARKEEDKVYIIRNLDMLKDLIHQSSENIKDINTCSRLGNGSSK